MFAVHLTVKLKYNRKWFNIEGGNFSLEHSFQIFQNMCNKVVK